MPPTLFSKGLLARLSLSVLQVSFLLNENIFFWFEDNKFTLVRYLSATGIGAVLGTAQLCAHKWKYNCRESKLCNSTAQNTENGHRCYKHHSIIFWPGRTCWRSVECAERNKMHVTVIHDQRPLWLAVITCSEQTPLC